MIEFEENDELDVYVKLVDQNNLFKWNVFFNGPAGTLYEVSLFNRNKDTVIDF